MRITRALSIALLTLISLATAAPARGAEPSLEDQIKAAAVLQTEDLGEPVKSVRDGMLLRAPNPDGKTWDLLQIYFPQYGGPNTIVIIDLGSDEVKQVQTEQGWNFHLCPAVVAPNGKLFISALNGRLQQKICLYDPATNALKLDAVKMPDDILGETHPLVLGTNGKLYAIGQHPSKAAMAVEIDPETLTATPYGPIGPSHAPSPCWGYSGAADDRFIYVASGKVPWYLVAFDRQTGKSTTLVETDTFGGMVSVDQRYDGCTGSATKALGAEGGRQDFWLHEGKAIPKPPGQNATAPWPERKPPKSLPPQVKVNTDRVVPDVEGFAELGILPSDAVKDVAAKKSASPAEALGGKRFRYQVPLYPHSIYRLREMPDGRVLGTAGAYEGNFVYDPKTGQARHLGKIPLSHYATTFHGGKVYMSGYPTSPLYVFDPARPWTTGTMVDNRLVLPQEERANPRHLLFLGVKELAGTHKMFAGVTGANGMVYFGGQWVRDGGCGGVAWYDPKTGKAGGMWEPLSNYQVTHLAAVDDAGTVVISTRRVDDPVLKKAKPDQGALWFLDTATNQLTGKFEPLAQAKGAGPILPAGGSRVFGWTEDPTDQGKSVLYGVEVRGPKLLFSKSLPCPLPMAIGSNQQEALDFRLGPDGWAWTSIRGALVRIDPTNGEVRVVGRLGSGGPIAFAADRLYLGGTTSLRRLKDPLPLLLKTAAK